MARNLGYMIVRELEKAANQRRRELARIEKQRQREQIKEYNAQIKAQEKADKERYISDQIELAEKMTQELLDSYEKYNRLIDAQLSTSEIFNFNSLKKEYVETKFKFSELPPIKKSQVIEIANPARVPKESWVEKIMPSKREKRLTIIKQNEKHIEEIKEHNLYNAKLAEEEYQKEYVAYEARQDKARIEWEDFEKKQSEIIQNENNKIELWNNKCLAGEDEAIVSYVDALFSTYNYALDTIVEHQVGYNKHNKKLIVNLHIANKEEIFEAQGYKYIKQRDEIDTIKMKVTMLNELIRNLMTEVCIATFHLLFRNNIGNCFETIVVNIYYDHICCVSAEVDNNTFNKHDFTTKSGISAFMQLQMRIYKQLSRGVKPFDTLFSNLV